MINRLLKRLVGFSLLMATSYLVGSFIHGAWIPLDFAEFGREGRFCIAFVTAIVALGSWLYNEDSKK